MSYSKPILIRSQHSCSCYSVGPIFYLNSTTYDHRCLDRNGTALSPTLPLCSRALGESGRQHSAISVKARTMMSCRIQVGYGSYTVVSFLILYLYFFKILIVPFLILLHFFLKIGSCHSLRLLTKWHHSYPQPTPPMTSNCYYSN